MTSEPTDHAAVYSKSLRTIAGHRAALAGGRGALVERLLGGGRELVKPFSAPVAIVSSVYISYQRKRHKSVKPPPCFSPVLPKSKSQRQASSVTIVTRSQPTSAARFPAVRRWGRTGAP